MTPPRPWSSSSSSSASQPTHIVHPQQPACLPPPLQVSFTSTTTPSLCLISLSVSRHQPLLPNYLFLPDSLLCSFLLHSLLLHASFFDIPIPPASVCFYSSQPSSHLRSSYPYLHQTSCLHLSTSSQSSYVPRYVCRPYQRPPQRCQTLPT